MGLPSLTERWKRCVPRGVLVDAELNENEAPQNENEAPQNENEAPQPAETQSGNEES